jgi:hypothetical protein
MFSKLFGKKPDAFLLDSAKHGRLEKIEVALKDGANLEARDKVSFIDICACK